ncbi:hypothetical protein T05_16074 [Trichinella murrelli]|uniref:Uncharacterized protein n=1 Tax=Trichinella murrelli TaxID=144512 RepID=A0A0V0SYV7_9BILA|nr:hypothetical protein T05_16074 [Trichinella murrelli]
MEKSTSDILSTAAVADCSLKIFLFSIKEFYF